jgi:hypothetical protein
MKIENFIAKTDGIVQQRVREKVDQIDNPCHPGLFINLSTKAIRLSSVQCINHKPGIWDQL